jgi:hypothetical protein
MVETEYSERGQRPRHNLADYRRVGVGVGVSPWLAQTYSLENNFVDWLRMVVRDLYFLCVLLDYFVRFEMLFLMLCLSVERPRDCIDIQ